MSLRVGDSLFSVSGNPGYLKERSENFRQYKVDTDRPTVQKEFRHGYINGLSLEERAQFNEFMDQIREKSDPAERINTMHDKIEELEKDPTGQGRHLASYVKAEMAHVMNQTGLQPRTYNIDMLKVR